MGTALRPPKHADTSHARTHARNAHVRYAWYDAESAGAFLLNIPTRFDFECKMHEMRDQGKSLTPALLKETMAAAWEGRYGDTLEVIDEIESPDDIERSERAWKEPRKNEILKGALRHFLFLSGRKGN